MDTQPPTPPLDQTPPAQPVTTPPIDSDPVTPAPVPLPTPNKPKWYKRKKFIVLIVLLVALVATACAWAYTQSGTVTPTPTSSQSSTQPAAQPAAAGVSTVAYSYETIQASTGNCSPSDSQLYWRPAEGGEKKTATDIGKSTYVSEHGVYENKVFAVTTAACDNKDAIAARLSTDYGKTYTKIYSGKPSTGNNNVLADQVTSAVFSLDGSSIVIATLPADADKNTVKEINIDTKSAKDLFTVDSRGVFLASYNSATQQAIYTTGCYNCDGGAHNTIYARDVEKGTETTLFKDEARYIEQIVPNQDASKLILVKSTPGELMGGGKPFIVEELNVASKAAKQLQTINEDSIVKVGYRHGDDMPYYSKGNAVYGIEANGNSVALFEGSKSIKDVHYVDKDHVFTSTGVWDSSDFELINYTLSTKSAVTLLNGDVHTQIFGVTWN